MSRARVLFAACYPRGEAASQRFRFEQYLRLLEARGVDHAVEPFWDPKAWSVLYRRGHRARKALGLVRGLSRRWFLLGRLRRYDVVYVHREMAPVGPPVFEFLVKKLLRRKLVYDFDDAIWMPNPSASGRIIERVKWRSKVGMICRWADRVSCGNEFLAGYARRFNPNVVVIPTVLDTDRHHATVRATAERVDVVGWTGSHSTIGYLRPLMPLLRELRERHRFRIQVIADRPPDFDADVIEFVPWRKSSEIDDLLRFDVGIMPVPDDDWGRGKCGLKILQYMALGVPAVASAVGANREIIEHGVDGILCADPGGWRAELTRLLCDPALRRRIAEAARRKVVERYSVERHGAGFLSLVDEGPA